MEARKGPRRGSERPRLLVLLPWPTATLLGHFLSSDANEGHHPGDTLSPSPKGRTGPRGPPGRPGAQPTGPRSSWPVALVGQMVRLPLTLISRARSSPSRHYQEGGGPGRRPLSVDRPRGDRAALPPAPWLPSPGDAGPPGWHSPLLSNLNGRLGSAGTWL